MKAILFTRWNDQRKKQEPCAINPDNVSSISEYGNDSIVKMNNGDSIQLCDRLQYVVEYLTRKNNII